MDQTVNHDYYRNYRKIINLFEVRGNEGVYYDYNTGKQRAFEDAESEVHRLRARGIIAYIVITSRDRMPHYLTIDQLIN